MSSPAPLPIYDRYLSAVREALEQRSDQWNFKSDAGYREVLEHTPVEFADAMLAWSLNALPSLTLDYIRSLCERNDSIGKPVQEPIVGLGTYSTSNMKYLCHAIKVWQHIESLSLPRVHIIEIGAGYGGLTLFVDGLESYFKTPHWTYTSIDLPEVAILQNRVTETLDLSLVAFDMTTPKFEAIEPGLQFCVSAYAFSEFDQATRDWYAEHVLRHCRHGLMVWNFPQALEGIDGRWFGGPPYQFVEWPITRMPDEPRLYDGHELVTW